MSDNSLDLPPTGPFVDRIVRIFRDKPHDDTSALVLRDYAAALARENAELRNDLAHDRAQWNLAVGDAVDERARAESAESANRALQAEVDRLNRAVAYKDDVLRRAQREMIPSAHLQIAIAYTGTEPQENPGLIEAALANPPQSAGGGL